MRKAEGVVWLGRTAIRKEGEKMARGKNKEEIEGRGE